MKITTAVPLAAGLAVGYVLGAAAGRARFQQIKTAATKVVRHPKVQQTVFDLAGQAKSRAQGLPGPVASLADTAATRLQDRLTHPTTDSATQPSGAATAPSPTSPGAW